MAKAAVKKAAAKKAPARRRPRFQAAEPEQPPQERPRPQLSPQAQVDDPREQERLRTVLEGIVQRLEREAESRVGKRASLEQRWLEDLRQLHGEYEDDVLKELKDAKKSQLFINQTRPKTNACDARLSDMLFPTDDKNWGIKPTPVPELDQTARKAVNMAKAKVDEANKQLAAGDPEMAAALATEASGPAAVATEIKAIQDEARTRAEAMEAEISDQLIECQYNIAARDVISDACRIGTGIMKGPIASNDRVRRSWRKDEKTGVYQIEMVDDPRPAFVRTDFWSFFPDPDARSIKESADFYERHLWTPKELRALARQPGFDKDAIRRLLKADSHAPLPTYLADLRSITGEHQAPADARFVGWEYRGPITAEALRDLASAMGRGDIAAEHEDFDELEEINVVIWFCDGEILKFGIHHMESGEPIYSVYNLEKDDSSIWGYGIPYLMRDSQKAMNAAWRMMMDNGGLSSGPQLEIDRSVVEPADGDWTMVPRKVWLRKESAPIGKDGIKVHNIENHQAEMQNIIALCKQFIDDETSISVLAQGEQGAHTTQTANGMALLMNAVNVVFRRMVKNFDDDMTVPNIRRLYDWNMQFSPKEHIKGDFDVDARGTSVLLAREIQSQNLMVLANFTAHPTLGILLKAAPILRKLAQSMMVPADEIILTDEELKQELAKQAKAKPPEDPSIEREHVRGGYMLQQAQLNRDTEMMKIAETKNMKFEDLKAKYDIAEMGSKSKERILAAEIAVETANRDKDRAADAQNPKGKAGAKGSGGYISA